MIMRIPLLRTVCKAIVAKADWDESKHPRADNGQFGSGSGGSSKPKKPSKTRRKMERREEAASQARVGGAIQSLLSGGSALDKIGWLNTSQKEPEKPATKPKEEAAPAKVPTPQTDIKVEDGEVAGSKILSLGNKRAGVIQHADGSFVVLSQVDRKTVDREEFEHLDVANRYAEAWLKGGQGAPKQQEKPKAEEKPKPTNKIESAKQEIANNIASGKLKKETVISAVKTMYERANEAERRGDDKTAKELDLRAEIMTDGAGIKGELYASGILQMRAHPLASIGRGMDVGQTIYTGRGKPPASDPKRDAEIRRLGRVPKPIDTLGTAHRIDNYRNKVTSRGEVLDELKEGEQNLGLYRYNDKTYLVDRNHPDQFGKISPDSWRRLKDELTDDDSPPPITSPHKQPVPPTQHTRSPQVTEAARSDILRHGKKIDEHGKASLHEYNGKLYMVTENKPMGIRISRPAWESTKY